jgi:hypothetical protein
MITCVLTVTVATCLRTSINCVDCTSQNGISRGTGVRDGSHRQVIYRPENTYIYRPIYAQMHAMWPILAYNIYH